MSIDRDVVKRFLALFAGYPEIRGIWHPERPIEKQCWTYKQGPDEEAWIAHLSGKCVVKGGKTHAYGLGVIPLDPQGNTVWGAIDIDAHSAETSIDIPALVDKIHELGLPLLVAKTRRSGAHAYLFLEEPTNAATVKKLLIKWARDLGFEGSETFPNQTEIKGSGSGYWLNMPYFATFEEETQKYCYHDGDRLSAKEFLDLAEYIKASPAEIENFLKTDVSDAPPCLESLISSGISSNNGYYQAAVYLRKKHGKDGLGDRLLDMWSKHGRDADPGNPFKSADIVKVANSVSRGKDFQYKCRETPMCDLCDKDACVRREFGISVSEKGILNLGAYPVFQSVEKLNTKPPLWFLKVDNDLLELTTSQFKRYDTVHSAAMEQLNPPKVYPPMSQKQWLGIYGNLVNNNCTIIDAPPEASSEGVIINSMWRFLSAYDKVKDPENLATREDILTGQPVLQKKDRRRIICFRGIDLVNYLKNNKTDQNKSPSELWAILRRNGVQNDQLRVGHKNIKIWFVDEDEDMIEDWEIALAAENQLEDERF